MSTLLDAFNAFDDHANNLNACAVTHTPPLKPQQFGPVIKDIPEDLAYCIRHTASEQENRLGLRASFKRAFEDLEEAAHEPGQSWCQEAKDIFNDDVQSQFHNLHNQFSELNKAAGEISATLAKKNSQLYLERLDSNTAFKKQVEGIVDIAGKLLENLQNTRILMADGIQSAIRDIEDWQRPSAEELSIPEASEALESYMEFDRAAHQRMANILHVFMQMEQQLNKRSELRR